MLESTSKGSLSGPFYFTDIPGLAPGDPTMRHREALTDVFPRRLRALVRNLPSAQKGDAEALHKTRVASRRVREALPMLADAVSSASWKKARRQTRRMTRALGRVRELDVGLDLLANLQAADEGQRLALERVAAIMVRDREALRLEMLDQLQAVRPNKLARKIAGLVGDLGNAAVWRQTLDRRLQSRVKRLRQAIDEAGELYEPARLHGVRLAVKKLRYVLELIRETGAQTAKPLVKTLKASQENLGRLHDVQVVINRIGTTRTELTASEMNLASELDALALRLEAACREHHAQYVADRAALEAVCDRAGGRLLWAVASPSPKRRPGHPERRAHSLGDKKRTVAAD